MYLFYAIFSIIGCLCLLNPLQYYAYSEPNNVEGDRKHHSKGKKHKSKLKISLDVVSNSYGVDLPAFAFDFSEYFVSGNVMIAADEKDSFITLFLLGHHSIYEDYPFEAMSTDHQTLNHWGQTTKKWENNKVINSHRSTRKRLFCLLRTGASTHPLQSTAAWLRLDSSGSPLERNSSNLNRNVEVLRCKLKLPLISEAETQYVLDVVELGIHNATDSDVKIVLSTIIPKEASSIGYPIALQQPDFSIASPKTRRLLSIEAAFEDAVPNQKKVYACVSNIRPLEAPRSLIGLPSIIEYIEHLLSFGIDHIFLGFHLHSNSLTMLKYQYVLSEYIAKKQITLLSMTSLPSNYQDMAGFSGMQLNDEFASIFLYNQCLQRTKYLPDSEYLLFLKSNQFLVPPSTSFSLKEDLEIRKEKFLKLLSSSLNEKKSIAYATFPSSLHSRHSGKSKSKGSVSNNIQSDRSDRRNLKGLPSSSSALPVCSWKIASSYGIIDSADGFPFGPSDFSFFKDYYNNKKIQSLDDSEKYRITVVDPRATNVIDVLPNGNILVLCDSHAKVRSKIGETSNNEILRSFFFQESFPSSSSSSPVPEDGKAQQQQFFNNLHDQILIPKNITMAVIKEKIKSFQYYVKSSPVSLMNSEILDRLSIKPPFWQPCNTNHLSDIFKKVFSN